MFISPPPLFSNLCSWKASIAEKAHIHPYTSTGGFKMSCGNNVRSLAEEHQYKCLGNCQADNIKHTEVRKKGDSEYIWIMKTLKSKHLGGNAANGINTWPSPAFKCTAGIVDCAQAELEVLDRKSITIITMNHDPHLYNDVDRLYLPRQIGGYGMLQEHQTVEEEKEEERHWKNIWKAVKKVHWS